ARAAARAGVSFRALPRGTEFCYGAVARIGRAPVVRWQWHTDVAPRLQPIRPSTVFFDSSSEEGRMLNAWGFAPKVLGYIPNVRGVITGLARAASLPAHRDRPVIHRLSNETPTLPSGGSNAVSSPSRSGTDRVSAGETPNNQRARDGSLMTWGTSQAPAPP